MRTRIVYIALSALLLSVVPALAEDGKGGLEGSVELLYRDVDIEGESRKYDEDYDGLDSGVRLGSLSANWLQPASGKLDYARLDMSGLGGDPYESTKLRLGRKDKFDLSFNYTKRDYIYNLFELVGNEDGATWDAQRRIADIALKLYPSDNVKLVFEFRDGQRSGTSLVMKDISRQLFRLETPLDVNEKRYTVGGDFKLGEVDFVVRQTMRRYVNLFDNMTEQNLGIELGSLTTLTHYDWNQRDSGSTDWTSFKVHAPLGSRVDLTIGVLGTFLGDDSLRSNVSVNADGTDFSGAPLSFVDGFSRADLQGDTTLVDADLSVSVINELDVHLQYREFDRDLAGTADEDLEGTGTSSSVNVQNDYSLSTMSAIVNYRPVRQIGLRVGYRMIDRELQRTGFLGVRNIDYDSKDDDTLIFGITLKPVDWFRLNADLEDGEVTQPFTAVAPEESDHLRVRATFTPQDNMRIDLGYLDFESMNTAPDIRDLGSFWNGLREGQSLSVSFWNRVGEKIDYMLRYAGQEIETNVGVTFDTAGFFGTETGFSIFDNDNTQYSGYVNCAFGTRWKGNVRFMAAESDGVNVLTGDATPAPGIVNSESIKQELVDLEVGLNYFFDGGMFVGGSYRMLDYEDGNTLLDYDGEIITLRAGLRF